MFKIDFAPGTIFLPRKKEREFYISTKSGIVQIPYGWVRSYSHNPPSITLTKDIRFRITSHNDPAIHTSHKEFVFGKDAFVTVTNISTGEKVWPAPASPSKRGFKWL